MVLLVRSWNLFHGNASPPERKGHLREAVELVSADNPDVVCLQEIPAWALGRLAGWSGMTEFGAVAARPAIGPLPSTAAVGRRLSSIHNGVLRSAFSGQANAILIAPGFRVAEHWTLALNTRAFRRAQARWLRLGLLTRLAWAAERRICHALRLRLPDGRSAVVANLHATSYRPDKRLADAELLRAATFTDGLARPGEPVLLCGDFNVTTQSSRTLHELAGPEWGFSKAGPGFDHVLVRSLEIESGPDHWPEERRRVNGRLLSDHAPVEVRAA